MPADARELVGKGDVDGAVGVLHHLGHLGGADVCYHNLALAETCVVLLHPLPHFAVVCPYGAVVVQQLLHHVAGDDALGGMHKVYVPAYDKAQLFYDGTHRLVNGTRTDGRFNHNNGTLAAHFQHFLDGGNHITGIYFLREFVVGRRHRHDVGVRLLILRCELDASLDGSGEKLVESILLEGGLPGIEFFHKLCVIVCSHHFHAMRGHHKGCGKSDVAQSNYINHSSLLFNI